MLYTVKIDIGLLKQRPLRAVLCCGDQVESEIPQRLIERRHGDAVLCPVRDLFIHRLIVVEQFHQLPDNRQVITVEVFFVHLFS